MIKMFLQFLFVLFWVITILVLVQAQDQTGFTSIDCELPEYTSYTEPSIGISYISGSKFINTGVSKSLSPLQKSNLQQQLWHMRSFPSGVRNCYRINDTNGVKYLIRTALYYGNYDNFVGKKVN